MDSNDDMTTAPAQARGDWADCKRALTVRQRDPASSPGTLHSKTLGQRVPRSRDFARNARWISKCCPLCWHAVSPKNSQEATARRAKFCGAGMRKVGRTTWPCEETKTQRHEALC
eukprot:2081218-Pleurochrysis_carterae.AAC.1